MRHYLKENQIMRENTTHSYFPELQIESKKDLERLTLERIQSAQYNGQPSWDILNTQTQEWRMNKNYLLESGISQQPLRNEFSNEKTKSKKNYFLTFSSDNTSNPKGFDNLIQKYERPSMQELAESTNERQIQILQNKQLSNYQYMRNQIKQILKLITITASIADEKQLKNRINELTAEVRKLKLRSISSNKIENQPKTNATEKQSKRIEQLQVKLKQMKSRTNKLNTKLSLMDNYIKVNRKDAHYRFSEYTFGSEYNLPIKQQEDVYKTKRRISKNEKSQKVIMERGKNRPILMNPYNSKLSSNLKSDNKYDQIQVMKQYTEMLKNTIEITKSYILKKQQCLHKQKMNLRRQIQIIKMSILKFQNENRRLRSMSNNSMRRRSMASAARALQSSKSQKNIGQIVKNATNLQAFDPQQNSSLSSRTIKLNSNKNAFNSITPHKEEQTDGPKMNAIDNEGILPAESIINSLSKQISYKSLSKYEDNQNFNHNIRNQYYDH